MYTRELAKALREENVDVLEESNPHREALQNDPRGRFATSLANARADARWAHELSRRTDVDVVHHLLPAHGDGPARQVCTVHDLAFVQRPDLFDRRFALWAAHAHRSAARAGHAVVVPSRTTAGEAMTRWGLHRDRVVVAPHGPGQALGPVTPAPAPRHVLVAGDDEPRKNLGLVRAATLPAGLAVRRATGGEPLEPLLAGALALVHPSLIEGFGLAAAEAMAAGVPVVAYPAPAVVELCGPAALYVRTATELTAALDRLRHDEKLRKNRAAEGLERARRYTWRASALAHLRAYRLTPES